jgi:acetyl-CoA decarbonylase/synthase complex subunit gamma
MALTGMDIFKLLPKTNCQDCGVATCLAFAMKLAAGQAELDACPHITPDVREKLEEASAPPIRQVVIGTGDNALKVGGETVLFRHEKTFANKPGIGLLLTDAMQDSQIDAKIARFKEIEYERIGQVLRADLIAVQETKGDTEKFLRIIDNVKRAGIGALVIMSEKTDVLTAGVKAAAELRPLIYAATENNLDDLHRLAVEHACPLAVKGATLDASAALAEKLLSMKFKDIIIDTGAKTFTRAFEDHVAARRAAVIKKYRPLGFPTIVFPCAMTGDVAQETLFAATFIPKYGSIIVLSEIEGCNLFPLTVQRMNIYTDPQRPMTTSEGIYEINSPDATSPVIITSNFSLTYFIVSSEIESSRVPTWLLIKDTEGLSVLTAWAAGKFSADSIGPFVRKCGIEEKIHSKKIIIPGCVANISGELEEEMKGWEINIGPREASALVPYLKNWK